ncbi:MAG: VOC family protein [Acidimicrobiales bacterium]
MSVRWLTMFIDRPAATFDVAADFWQQVTGTTRSPTRGEDGQFATLLPTEGDAHVRVQRIGEGAGGTHLDVHTDDRPQLVARAVELGAAVVSDGDPDVTVLASPTGYPWCVVGWDGGTTPSVPHVGPAGAPSRLDQICLDIGPDGFDAEVRFWTTLLDWPVTHSKVRPEFASAPRPDGLPMRLLFQRLEGGVGPTTGHLDVAAGWEGDAVIADHVAAGAEVEARETYWTVLRDPSGHRYCVTLRDPVLGVVTQTPPAG